MKRKTLVRVAIVSGVIGALSAAVYAQDKFDKYSLKSPSGIAFSDFRDTRTGRWSLPPGPMKCSR